MPLFASRIGLIAATVGSAVGLGNVWRFPAEVQQGGGAAFVIVYVLCVFLLGVPVMVAEFAIGRAGRSDAVGVFERLGAGPAWRTAGAIAILASYMILCFYMVVAGWTFEYLMQSLTGALYAPVQGVAAGAAGQFQARMTEYISQGWNPLINTWIVIALNIGVLVFGVQKGIERLSNVLMPLLFLILIVFACVSLSLPGAAEGVRFFLDPDFSRITPAVTLSALGQAFFSLSLGMGILVTYASYYPAATRLTRTAVTVSLLDLLVAMLMGFIIFPAVTTFGLTGENMQGATLVFVTLPEVFSRMPACRLWSSLFFLLLTLAAVTSTISIAEVTVAFLGRSLRLSRLKATLLALLPLFLFSTVCSLSQGPLGYIRIAGRNIFDFLDNTATNLMLPVASILLCIYIGWFAPRGMLLDQLSNSGSITARAYRPVMFIIRYIAPALIALVLFSTF